MKNFNDVLIIWCVLLLCKVGWTGSSTTLALKGSSKEMQRMQRYAGRKDCDNARKLSTTDCEYHSKGHLLYKLVDKVRKVDQF